MTDKEIIDFVNQHPNMKNDPGYKAMYEKAVKRYNIDSQPEINKVHDEYVSMIWKCKYLIDFDPHCDLWGVSEAEYDQAINKWRKEKEDMIEGYKANHLKELIETNAIEDGDKVRDGEDIDKLLLTCDDVCDLT